MDGLLEARPVRLPFRILSRRPRADSACRVFRHSCYHPNKRATGEARAQSSVRTLRANLAYEQGREPTRLAPGS
jgi:hypothetical protein